MLKWITNSKAGSNSKKSNYKGVRLHSDGKYIAVVTLSKNNKDGKKENYWFHIGSFKTEKEAVAARVEFILGLL